MAGTRRKFSEEFKREAVELSYNCGKSVEEVARDLGIGRNVLSRWRREAKELGQQAFPAHGADNSVTP